MQTDEYCESSCNQAIQDGFNFQSTEYAVGSEGNLARGDGTIPKARPETQSVVPIGFMCKFDEGNQSLDKKKKWYGINRTLSLESKFNDFQVAIFHGGLHWKTA